MDEAPAGNGRAPVRDDEVADGTSPFPGAWTEKSESRICLGRAELQSQAGDRHLGGPGAAGDTPSRSRLDRKSTRLNSSHTVISYAVFCLKKKKRKASELKSVQSTSTKARQADMHA